jgi:hypothetical protein
LQISELNSKRRKEKRRRRKRRRRNKRKLKFLDGRRSERSLHLTK